MRRITKIAISTLGTIALFIILVLAATLNRSNLLLLTHDQPTQYDLYVAIFKTLVSKEIFYPAEKTQCGGSYFEKDADARAGQTYRIGPDKITGQFGSCGPYLAAMNGTYEVRFRAKVLTQVPGKADPVHFDVVSDHGTKGYNGFDIVPKVQNGFQELVFTQDLKNTRDAEFRLYTPPHDTVQLDGITIVIKEKNWWRSIGELIMSFAHGLKNITK